MRGAVIHAPGDVRFEQRDDPAIVHPTDAIIRMSATCVCGSDLWPYRGADPITEPAPMGHEYCGIVEEVGAEVRTLRPGQFVIGSFFASDNTCEICRSGYQSSCVNRVGSGPTGRRRSTCGSRWPTAPWSPPLRYLPMTFSPACCQRPTSWAPVGSEPSPPRCSLARPSPSSATGPSVCSESSQPGRWALSASSR